MNIALQVADLDASRIDGTRVYILRLLEHFGVLFPNETWHLYHRRQFNPALTPPEFPNYIVHTVSSPFFWTQTRFLWEMFQVRPDRVFMPVQALPIMLPKGTESVVTIHDLAFKIFPQYFPPRDVRRLNWFTNFAAHHATRLIAVSESTKRDILEYYPDISEEKIRVIHHGFDTPPVSPNSTKVSSEANRTLRRFGLNSNEYILYMGALQPRKNLARLMEAFEAFASTHSSVKLVLAGEAAWMSREIFRIRETHPFRERIIFPGRVTFAERGTLYEQARIFVFPSLYEGFGLPILEAFARNVPVICAHNSSLPEVAGDAARFFDASRSDELADALLELWDNEGERNRLVARGRRRLTHFSWSRCARETAQWIVR